MKSDKDRRLHPLQQHVGRPDGTQCTGLDSVDESTIAWHTSFSWNGGSPTQVKSFPNAALHFKNVQLANVESIPSTFEYKFEYNGKVVANVAYDLFTTSKRGGDAEYEIMIWLAAHGGAGPISSMGSAILNTTIADIDFSVYHGKNGNMTVYAYVAAKPTTSFSADLKQFIDELPAKHTISPKQYLTHVQAGTEPFRGNATLTVSKYSAPVNTA